MEIPAIATDSRDWETPNASSSASVLPEAEELEGHIAGLSQVRSGAFLFLLGSALSGAAPIVFYSTGYLRLSLPSPGTYSSGIVSTALFVPFTFLVGLAFSLVAFLFYRDGFGALRTLDDRFRWSPSFAWLAIIGIVFVVVGLAALALALSTFELYWGLGLLVIGVVLGLVGSIGTLVGVWRIGVRYAESMFQIGAILTLLPVLSIVGQLLVLLGSTRVRSRLLRGHHFPVVDRVPTLQ